MTITEALNDAAAILDAEGIDQVVLYGTSYGSYLAQGFGVMHADRVAGMVLDSTMFGVQFGASSTELLRSMFWWSAPETAEQAASVRRLVDQGVIDSDEAGYVLQLLYELGGLDLVAQMLELVERGKGRRFWRWLLRLGENEVMTPRPFVVEFDLVGEIAYRELDYSPPRDGGPLWHPGFDDAAGQFSPFHAEPFDLPRQMRDFDWPVVVISGDRDIRTPRAIAEEVVAAVPNGVLMSVRAHGHSALDTHPRLAMNVMRTVAEAIASDGDVERKLFPDDPQGSPSLMRKLVDSRLVFARISPKRLS